MTTRRHRDPVCGMSVEAGKEAGSITHGGREYLFCSKHCASKFHYDPDKYAGHRGEEAEHSHDKGHDSRSQASAGIIYTCPMHPEIRQIGPG